MEKRKASGLEITWGWRRGEGRGHSGPCKLSQPPLPGDRERRYGTVRNLICRTSELLELTKKEELSSGSRVLCEMGLCPILYAILDSALIPETVPIIHGPQGCHMNNRMLSTWTGALGFFYPPSYGSSTQSPIKRIVPEDSICTCLDENDIIFGAEAKLKEAILEVDRRYKPKIIPVCATCTSSIIGDDVFKVVNQVKDQVDAYVFAMNTEGICNLWDNGRNTFWHGLVYGYMEEPKKKVPNRINFITNYTATPSGGLQLIQEWCARLGIELNMMPLFSTPHSIKTAPESAATAGICQSVAMAVGEYMLDRFNVPYLHAPQPISIKYFKEFMGKIAEFFGKEREFESMFEREMEKYGPDLEKIKSELKGIKAALALGGGKAIQYAQMLREVGIETVILGFYFYTRAFSLELLADFYEEEKKQGRDPLLILNPQTFETFKAVYQTKPDYYFTDYNSCSRMQYLGARGLTMSRFNKIQWMFLRPYMFGIEGVVNFGKELLRRKRSKYYEIFRPYQNIHGISERWYANDQVPLGKYLQEKRKRP